MAKRDPLHETCRALPGVTEDVKWEKNLVFSVGDKMFASFQIPDGEPFGCKVDPDAFDVLVQRDDIEPAPYLARASWISIQRRETLPLDVLRDLLREAHALVAAKLSKKKRRELGIEAG